MHSPEVLFILSKIFSISLSHEGTFFCLLYTKNTYPFSLQPIKKRLPLWVLMRGLFFLLPLYWSEFQETGFTELSGYLRVEHITDLINNNLKITEQLNPINKLIILCHLKAPLTLTTPSLILIIFTFIFTFFFWIKQLYDSCNLDLFASSNL